MKKNEKAFPYAYKCNNEIFYQDGMTLKEYAAIKLKVPRSGDPDLDVMIRKRMRSDFATNTIDTAFCQYSAIGKRNPSIEEVVTMAYKIADAMLAEMDKEEKKK